MKNIKFTFRKALFLLSALFTIMVGCERELSDEAVLATFPSTAEIFTDTPVGLGSNFYFPFVGSKPTAWSVDESEGYNSKASMRFDVPNVNDPEGSYAGAIFRVDGAGRDLTGYNALTFWAKGTRSGRINEIGFGQDFFENKYLVSTSLQLTTNWQKYVIPIPDASKLVEERGVFWYAEGPENGEGYSFWIDELKFENLGTMAQPQPAISNGEDRSETAFTGVDIALTGLTQTFNLGTGNNVTVNAAPSYFKFFSSNEDIATVNDNGVVSIIGEGTAKITATLGGVVAKGSLELTSRGAFNLAPTPTRDPSKVISIYSDSYTNVPVDFFNGYWEPFQTTQSSEFSIGGNSMINYTNFNFVGNQFANPTVDATQKSNLHINMYIPNSVPANIDFLITVVDFGADQADGGGDDTREQIFFNKALFVADSWITLEFPITMNNRNNIGLIIYENINGSSLSNFYLDNIYFYEN
ncbi:glycosyl hydrolase family 16 [Flavobacteriaceae bacterium SZ-1-7]|uniref:Ig-like domain-containing protein n=1 Tax=Tamlana sedimenti TaxID=3134126 RepID=UPI003128DE92